MIKPSCETSPVHEMPCSRLCSSAVLERSVLRTQLATSAISKTVINTIIAAIAIAIIVNVTIVTISIAIMKIMTGYQCHRRVLRTLCSKTA